MSLQDALNGLKTGLGAVPGLKTVRGWEGPWDALASPDKVSMLAPAALVSLIDLVVVDVGRTLDGLRMLAPSGAGVSVPPVRRPAEARPRPTCRLEVAVTVLLGGPDIDKRATDMLGFAEQAVAVMVENALERIAGENLNSDKLREKGLSAFVLTGYREIEIEPADPERQLPEGVSVVHTLSLDDIYPPPEC